MTLNGLSRRTLPRTATGARPRLLAMLAATLCLAALTAACSRPSAERLNDDGNHAFNRGDYGQALEDYRKAQVERPDQPTFNYNAGNALHQQGDYPRAIQESLRSTQGSNADVRVRAYYSIGADYYREGKLKEALDAYKNALRLDPNDLDTKYNLEVIQRRLDKEAEQRQALDQQAKQDQPSDQQNPQGSQNQPDQAGQQNPQPQQGGQPGQQSQPGQQQGQQPQPGQGQQGQQGPAQSGQQQNGQPGQPNGQANGNPAGSQAAGSLAPGTTGTPGPSAQQQQAALNQDLRNAIDAYGKQASIEEALRILDILAQQEQIAQAEQGNRSDPRTRDK